MGIPELFPRYVDIPSYCCSNLGKMRSVREQFLVSYFAINTILVCLSATLKFGLPWPVGSRSLMRSATLLLSS